MQDMAQLSKATQFDFYEFGKGRIAHAVFSAKTGLCQDFKSKRGVALKWRQITIPMPAIKAITSALFMPLSDTMGNIPISLIHRRFRLPTRSACYDQALEKQDGERVAQMNLKEKSVIDEYCCQ